MRKKASVVPFDRQRDSLDKILAREACLTEFAAETLAGFKRGCFRARRNHGRSLPKHFRIGRAMRYRLRDVQAWLKEQQQAHEPAIEVPARRGRLRS